ncbi:MAG TPA: class I SAM-dependent methyltransferase [Candidatus Krumholzibacteria bacterium]|nr:class I SAM-dependent methyltransferase [Candidatus Krumholzibacteria bacterium]
MRNAESWVPTKFVRHGSEWRGSRDTTKLARGSRLVGDIVAGVYAQALGTYARGHLLDLGCGEAPLYGVYRALVTNITCVDWAGSLHATRHADVLADLNETCPLPDETFDTILCTDVIEHLKHPERLFMDAARMLRSGGHLILGTPYLYPLHELPHDYFRSSASALEMMARDARLTVVELRPYGSYRHVLGMMLAKKLQHIPLVRSLVPRLALMRRRHVRVTTAFPLGYLVVASK